MPDRLRPMLAGPAPSDPGATYLAVEAPYDGAIAEVETVGPEGVEVALAAARAAHRDRIDTAMRAARRLDASAVMVNDHTAFRTDWMPFAGLRESGLSTGGIPYSMDDMQIEKMLVVRSREL